MIKNLGAPKVTKKKEKSPAIGLTDCQYSQNTNHKVQHLNSASNRSSSSYIYTFIPILATSLHENQRQNLNITQLADDHNALKLNKTSMISEISKSDIKPNKKKLQSFKRVTDPSNKDNLDPKSISTVLTMKNQSKPNTRCIFDKGELFKKSMSIKETQIAGEKEEIKEFCRLNIDQSKNNKDNPNQESIEKTNSKIHMIEDDKYFIKLNSNSVTSKACRICYEGEDLNNYLIQPCKCEGSMKYIHEECLKKWIDSNKKALSCEICGSQFYVRFQMEKKFSKFLFSRYCKKIIKAVLMGLVVLIVFFITIYFIVTNTFKLTSDNYQLFMIIIICFTILTFVGLILCAYYKYKNRWFSVTMKSWKIYDINQGKAYKCNLAQQSLLG